ncbi:ImmA/IrrE family metallo-endopeptidase [Shouchella lonarensis]|uniref:IrrE N-terminal-like domain-containing protein n=1 Tax=Shouchella lonarensis TaxID=1464122 RepID=A0A1G6HSC4_9BACI|nr:ImmA/IrrE family metallo-endopeptidase [Shouchella lonarensis]SDB97048.1 protein of unknown function [Shouchella lonarensis]
MKFPTTSVNTLTKKYGTSSPFKLARHLGIEVVFGKLGDKLGCYIHTPVPIILLNANVSDKQQVFACAHELGHVVLHQNINIKFLKQHTCVCIDKLEDEADYFALELLRASGKTMTLDEIVYEYGVPRRIALSKIS